MVLVAAPKPPAVVVNLDDVAVVGEVVGQRRGHLGVVEQRRPLGKQQVGRDERRGLIVKAADLMEQQLATTLEQDYGQA